MGLTTDGTLPAEAIKLHVTAATTSKTASYDLSSMAITFPTAFGIQLPPSYSGSLTVTVDAMAADGTSLATGTGSVNVHVGKRVDVALTLHVNGPVASEDMASSPSTDMAGTVEDMVAPTDIAFGPDMATPPVVDQYNLGDSNGYYSTVNAGQHPGQTFTVGKAGQLAGIEVGLTLGSKGGTTLTLVVYDSSATILGSKTNSAALFPSCCSPQPLKVDKIGPAYFDVTSLNIQVTPGQKLIFDLRPGEAASEYYFGEVAGDVYPGGTEWYGGMIQAGTDFDFKTFVR